MIRQRVFLSDYCAYKTGGPAEYLAEPSDTDELIDAIRFARTNDLPVTVIGKGANVLVHDDGVRGLVIVMGRLNDAVTRTGDNLLAGAGVVLDDLVKFAVTNGLAGLENLSGIPGTVGGALRMNAGAFGTEMKDVTASIDILGNDLSPRTIPAEEARFGYRQAPGLDDAIILGARFSLEPGSKDELMSVRKEILMRRAEKQPLEYPSCGSVFKRPEGHYAGTLIERCGLKGYSIGGAKVSEKHANFVLNTGSATSADIDALIKHVKAVVKEETGVELTEEVRRIGF